MADLMVERDAKGIPLKSIFHENISLTLLVSFMSMVNSIVGFLITWYVSYIPESKRVDVNAKIAILAKYDLGWLYMGIFVIRILQLPQNVMLGEARKASKVGVPDQHVYKVMGSEGSKLGYVLMDNEGDHGRFNRAQRASMNYHEGFPTIALMYVAASFVFPFDAFITITVFALSKILSVRGYISSEKRRLDGAMGSFITISTLHAMVGIAAFKSLMI